MRIELRGRDLPGRTAWSETVELKNVHVGLQERADPIDLVPGDAAAATWALEVAVTTQPDNRLDFAGPVVQGRRGQRYLYLTWGDVGADGSFAMFRRAKLMLDAIDPRLVRAAEQADRTLVGEICLTDRRGGPICAQVKPPDLVWSVR